MPHESATIVTPLSEVVKNYFGVYATYVIKNRAIPDIRDGLKPVHRRIIYGAWEMGAKAPNKMMKSAKIVGNCLVAGSLVSTKRGLIPIEKVKIGDSVYTQKGLKKVTELFYQPNQPLLKITSDLNIFENKVTKGHKFKVLNRDLSCSFKKASSLSLDDYLIAQPSFVDFKDNYLEHEVYALGMFMSDGGIDRYKCLNYLCFSNSETNVLEFIKENLKIESKIFKCKGSKVKRLKLSRKKKVKAFLKKFGIENKYNYNIDVNSKIMKFSNKSLLSFISGFIDGDGFIRDDHNEIVICSVSRKFLKNLGVLLFDRFGVVSSINLSVKKGHKSIVNGREVVANYDCFNLTFTGSNAYFFKGKLKLLNNKKKIRLESFKENNFPSLTSYLPYFGKKIFDIFSDKHIGAGWYKSEDGEKFRLGIKYKNGIKIRYSKELSENINVYSDNIEELNILKKLKRLDKKLYDQLKYIIDNKIRFVKVSKIEKAADEVTYDFTVEDKHEFFVNGVISHNCMGNYHPHGDSAIYDTMVRLTQDFNMRIPLFDSQGNFGSVDGDPAAASRYTECRLNRIGVEMFCQHLNKEVVSFVENYDGTTTEPEVLPADLPHLLLNYDHGIAVGIHSNIMSCAPHEIIDCLIGEIDEGLITKHDSFSPKGFKGPDLATYGIMEFDKDQANSLWMTGDSRWMIRGEAKFETDERTGQQRVVIISLPFQQKKEDWLADTAKLAIEKDESGKKKIEGIVDIRDESNKANGIRIVFDLKNGMNSEVVLNQIYKRTKLQKSITTDIVAIKDGKPQHLGAREVLLCWLDFRRDCIRKILKKEKREKEERIEIIDGLMIVHANVEDVIKVIRGSEDAKDSLIKKFKFTDRQATSVIAMRLGSLRKLDEDALKIEKAELQERVDEIISILKDPKKVDALIKERLEWWKTQLNERQTKIVKEFGEISTIDTVVDEDVVVAINNRDEIKVTSIHDYRKSRRGAGGVNSTANTEDADSIPRLLAQVTTLDMLYAFTNKSRVFEKPCHELPITKRTSKSVMSDLFTGLEDGERIVDIVAMNIADMDENESLIMVRSNGNVKRMACRGLLKKRGRLYGDECCRTDLDDSSLIRVTLAPKDSDLLVFTKNGLCRRIKVETLRMVPSRKSGAPACMKLKSDDEVVGVSSVNPGDSIATVSANGFGARFKEDVLVFKKGRIGGGVRLCNSNNKTGLIVFGDVFDNENSELFLTTSGGKSLRVAVSDIRETGRGTQGVRVQKLKNGESIVAVTKVSDI